MRNQLIWYHLGSSGDIPPESKPPHDPITSTMLLLAAWIIPVLVALPLASTISVPLLVALGG